MSIECPVSEPTAIRTHLGAIFVSLELSRSSWLVTSLSPGLGEKMSKRSVRGGDANGLLALLDELKRKARARSGVDYPIICIQEAGLDGFWLHRVLEDAGVESHVVDAASIAAPRRKRRVKTDRIDGEALLRALLAFKRGEPRVCSMAQAPSVEEEDMRRPGRERQALLAERGQHVNRIKGLLFSQGIGDYEPLRRDRRRRLPELRTGDGRKLPPHLLAQIERELARLELLLDQIAAVERARDALLAQAAKAAVAPGPARQASAAQQQQASTAQAETPDAPQETPDARQETPAAQQEAPPTAPPAAPAAQTPTPVALLLGLKGIGAEAAALLWTEGFSRSFSNRRQIASYAGLAATPWRSGSIAHEQGVSRTGNARLRTMMVQLAWLWLRHQPQSALSLWFAARVANARPRRKTMIVALARKLLVALWKYVAQASSRRA